MVLPKKCKIVNVGKRRDGRERFWCLEHKADATAKYGLRAPRCRCANDPPIGKHEILKLDIRKYEGGVGIWGAVPPVYDTTSEIVEVGVHVHARRNVGSKKEIDGTYRRVDIVAPSQYRASNIISVSDADAIHHTISSVFELEVCYVECEHCQFPHLDCGSFAVYPHRVHLCAGCGKMFRASRKNIGNPIRRVKDVFAEYRRPTKEVGRKIEFSQSDFGGGIQIWGSNPAAIWTAKREEEEGIHIHAFGAAGAIEKDETYSSVTIDGISLEANPVRVLMAQLSLPHIASRVVSLDCPSCGQPHFDTRECALVPHIEHECDHCGKKFTNVGRLKKTISNPALGWFITLQGKSERPRKPLESAL